MFEISSERGKGERAFDLTPDGGDLCIQQSTTIKGLQKVDADFLFLLLFIINYIVTIQSCCLLDVVVEGGRGHGTPPTLKKKRREEKTCRVVSLSLSIFLSFSNFPSNLAF